MLVSLGFDFVQSKLLVNDGIPGYSTKWLCLQMA